MSLRDPLSFLLWQIKNERIWFSQSYRFYSFGGSHLHTDILESLGISTSNSISFHHPAVTYLVQFTSVTSNSLKPHGLQHAKAPVLHQLLELIKLRSIELVSCLLFVPQLFSTVLFLIPQCGFLCQTIDHHALGQKLCPTLYPISLA